VSSLGWSLPFLVLLAAPLWSPAEFADESTLEFLTVEPGEGEHWSTVWFVVIDGTVYVRLGPRAAGRIEKNSTAPRMQVRLPGRAAVPVRYEPAPDKLEAVAVAMRAKYWTDRLGEPFRKLGLSSVPLILRIVPESPAG
jgi:hypothetical protein